ncbi:MAG: hypothetical protein J5905_08135 [Prevotella sp.]|nr:hypothetical protein [Prevotella sp.]
MTDERGKNTYWSASSAKAPEHLLERKKATFAQRDNKRKTANGFNEISG